MTVEGHERSTPPTATYAQLTAMKKQKLEELKKSYRFIGNFFKDSVEPNLFNSSWTEIFNDWWYAKFEYLVILVIANCGFQECCILSSLSMSFLRYGLHP